MVRRHLTLGRRTFLFGGAAAWVAGTTIGKTAAAAIATLNPDQDVVIEKFSAAGKGEGSERVPKVVKSDTEWRNQLSAASYRVTRHAGTELPFSGRYASLHADGLYRCICCDTALFDSKSKYE